MSKKLVYICSPCRGDYEKNIDNAAIYSHEAIMRGYIPITPHLYFTRFMDDTKSNERSIAMEAGCQLLLMCSEVWVFGLDQPSEGMQAEIALAIRHGIPIKDGMEMIRQKANNPEADTLARTADKFTSLSEMFKHANVQIIQIREEVGPCQQREITKAIRILPRPKR